MLHGIEDHTVGLPTTLPWGINFGDGIARHPTSLYEILLLLWCFIGLRQLDSYATLPDGMRFKLFLSTYLIYRFLVAFIQPSYLWFGMLSAIQLACLACLMYYTIDATRKIRHAMIAPMTADFALIMSNIHACLSLKSLIAAT